MKKKYRHPESQKEGDFFVLNTASWVNILALTPEREVILVEQYRFGIASLSLEVPGGLIDPGETPEKTAPRELREETGYTGNTPTLIGECYPNPAIMNNRCYFVKIEGATLSHNTQWDPHEELGVHKVPLDEVFRKIREGKIRHSLSLNALYTLRESLEA